MVVEDIAELMYMIDFYTDNLGLPKESWDRFIKLGNEYTGSDNKNNGAMCIKRMYFKVKGYKN